MDFIPFADAQPTYSTAMSSGSLHFHLIGHISSSGGFKDGLATEAEFRSPGLAIGADGAAAVLVPK